MNKQTKKCSYHYSSFYGYIHIHLPNIYNCSLIYMHVRKKLQHIYIQTLQSDIKFNFYKPEKKNKRPRF